MKTVRIYGVNRLVILSEQKSFIKKGKSNPCIVGQESAFLSVDNVDAVYKNIVLKNISRVLNKIGLPSIADGFTKKKDTNAVYMYIAMNLNFLEANAYLLKSLKKHGNKISLYIYDCWEPEFDDWQKVMDDIKPDYVFFCFRQTYEHYKDIYNAYWVPQSADLSIFKDEHLEKTRMFMSMGRVNEGIHKKILEYMEKHNIEDNRENYVYRKDRNEEIYPDIQDLVTEINKTKYFVSVPKCYENFKRTGNVCGITARYFEAMACKTLIIGKKPIVIDELFSKDCMIEFNDDLSDFDSLIDEMEKSPEKYQEIVDKNYECLMNNHTWQHRARQILEIINQ